MNYGACRPFEGVRMKETFVSPTFHQGPYIIKHFGKGQAG